MGKQLRIGFAMGGGVSLGTFNGAALSEVLKLAILYAVDKDGKPYEEVVVDVFSGASAGSMALGVMLRSLVYRSDEAMEAAMARLEEEYPPGERPWDGWKGKAGKKRLEDLKAAQAMQTQQEEVWGQRSISLPRLLYKGSPENGELRHKASVLNREVIDLIAKTQFKWPASVPRKERLTKRRLLGKRVLFACALSNLSGTVIDASSEFSELPMERQALADGARSVIHRELRVFDLSFEKDGGDWNDAKKNPRQWNRYRAYQGEDTGTVGDLTGDTAWAKMAATAIASGAFPFAFEPVVLERSWWERQPKVGEEPNPEERESRLFTYADGGMFNNEPIREAFRMAALIDAHDSGTEFDRRIVFVDPNVSPTDPPRYMKLHQTLDLDTPYRVPWSDYKLTSLPTLKRLIPYMGHLAGSLAHQASVVEGDKYFQIRESFALRRISRQQLLKVMKSSVSAADVQELAAVCEAGLEQNLARLDFPTHSADVAREMANIVYEDWRIRGVPDTVPFFSDLDPTVTVAHAQTYLDDPTDSKTGKAWFRALCFLAMDLATELVGKNEAAKLIPIAPVSPVGTDGKHTLTALPGGRLAGFGGFMSDKPDEYEYAMGRYAAWLFLNDAGLLATNTPAKEKVPPFNPKLAKPSRATPNAKPLSYEEELQAGTAQLVEHLKNTILDGLGLPVLVDKALETLLHSRIKDAADNLSSPPDPCYHLMLRIRVDVAKDPDELEFRGPGNHDLAARSSDGKWYLCAPIAFYPERSKNWAESPLLDPKSGAFHIDRNHGGLGWIDGELTYAPLPDKKTLASALDKASPVIECMVQDSDGPRKFVVTPWTVKEGITSLAQDIEDYLKG